MADFENSTSWLRMLWKFACYLVLNYTSCALILHITGNILYSMLLLTCYVSVAKFWNEVFSRNGKGQWSFDSLTDELMAIDMDKRSFVIEKFVQIDRNRGRKSKVRESERCVVCMDQKAEIQTLPCRHRVICGLCAWGTLQMALQQSVSHTCVVCRSQIRDFNGSLFKNLVNVTRQDIRTILDETKADQTQPRVQ